MRWLKGIVARDLRLFFELLRPNPVYEGQARRKQHRAMQIALLGVAAAGATYGAATLLLPPPWGESIATGEGEWMFVRLPDGTQVHAGPNTKMNVRYRDDERRIFVKKGEVYYKVAHVPLRPFRVLVGGNEVLAVGTAFNVSYAPPATGNVSVIEGVVTVTKARHDFAADELGREYTVMAGEEAVFSRGSIEVTVPEEPGPIRWDGANLSVEGATLGELVSHLNLSGRAKIVIDDPAVAALVIPDWSLRPFEIEKLTDRLRSSANLEVRIERDVLHLKTRPGPCESWLRCG